jgi:hypothetical protein
VTSPRSRLLQDLNALERRLRREWAQETPPLSAELRRYRQDWVRTLVHGKPRRASEHELHDAVRAGDPLVVGDHHALHRSRHGLGDLVRDFPAEAPAGLLLELLPRGLTVDARAALRRGDLRLVDGRPLAEAYRSALSALARRGGIVAGAWVDGSPGERDLAAAARWRELADREPARRWMISIGDWHLAESHLPAQLRRLGAAPVVLHQSPEPIWGRHATDGGEAVLDLGAGHWAWLHTPPLEQWASALQEVAPDDPEAAAEATEELVEALADHLARAAGLPAPAARPSVWPTPLWDGFRATLPEDHRRALVAGPPPRCAVFHPRLPAVWIPGPSSFNQLAEAAAHVLACDSELGVRGDLHGRLCARAFRRLWASLLNPFLRPSSPAEAARVLFPVAAFRPRLGRVSALLRSWEHGEEPYLSPARRLLAVEVLGARAGTMLAADPGTDHAFVELFLRSGGRALGWEALTATIRAA